MPYIPEPMKHELETYDPWGKHGHMKVIESATWRLAMEAHLLRYALFLILPCK